MSKRVERWEVRKKKAGLLGKHISGAVSRER